VLVLVCDPQVHRLRLERAVGALGRLDFELLPTFESEALRARRAVDADGARSDESLRFRARIDFREAGEKAIEPEPGRRVRNA
jgi:hypothetical protein